VDVPDSSAESNTTGTPNDPKLWQGPWKTITNPTELASIVKEINRKQYHQAHTTGCHDRLVNNLILMVLRKLGISKTATTSLGKLWDQTIHLIKTIYGTSDITYTSTADMPLYGLGQGSMCGPIFWLLCYWLIVSSLDPSITAAQYISVCRTIIVNITGVSFVDDTGLGVTSDFERDPIVTEAENDESEIRHVVHKLKQLAQHWERLLFSTGGAINLQKGFWYLMAWQENKGKSKLATIAQQPAEILLTSGNCTDPTILPRIDPNQAFKTLGVYISASGCQQKQSEVLRITAQQYFESVHKSSCSHWKLTYRIPYTCTQNCHTLFRAHR
jgi:hypothetical protein